MAELEHCPTCGCCYPPIRLVATVRAACSKRHSPTSEASGLQKASSRIRIAGPLKGCSIPSPPQSVRCPASCCATRRPRPRSKPSSGLDRPRCHGPLTGTGKLRLQGEIARGGMGAILKGHDEDLGRDLAVKVLLEAHCNQPDLVRRFVEEAQICGQLQHPGVVPIYELGTFDDRRPYFSMKLVKGKTLGEMLLERASPRDELPRFLSIFEQVCQTVAYAHARGVIHRDLKPSNVMVGSFGEVQVMDWGLAKVLPRGGVVDDGSAGRLSAQPEAISTARSGSDVDNSVAGSVLGTPSYMAPEQARGEITRVDGRADVFALGAILCEILAGQPPFTGRTSGEILQKAAAAELADARSRLEACGADLDLVTLSADCLAPDLDIRPRNAGVVAERLRAYFEGVQEKLRAAEREIVVAEAKAGEERKHRRLTMALAASVLALVALGAGGYTWIERQRSLRRQATARLVDLALEKAIALRGEAEADETVAVVRLDAALGEVKRAEDVGRHGDSEPSLLSMVERTRQDLTRLRQDAEDRARRADTKRAIQIALDDIRIQPADWDITGPDSRQVEARCAAAFRAAGIDPDGPDAGRSLRDSPMRENLLGVLDAWAQPKDESDKPRVKLLALADAADESVWRRAFRSAVVREDVPEMKRLAALEEAAAQSPTVLAWLGKELRQRQAAPESEALLRRAQVKYPGEFWINYELGVTLARRSRRPEATGYMMAALALRPSSTFARWFLALLQRETGDPEEAIRNFRRLEVALPKQYFVPFNHAMLLLDQGDLTNAELACRRAMAILPGHDWAHNGLGLILRAQGKLTEAVESHRTAIRLRAASDGAHTSLADGLRAQGKLDQAIQEYREALRRDPKDAFAHCGLGSALRLQGRYDEALKELKLGDANGRGQPGWTIYSAALVRQCEREIGLLTRLPALVDGTDKARNPEEAATFAQLCSDRGRHAVAVRFWTEAFSADPKLALDREDQYRSSAAFDAALAGCGQGCDTPLPDEPARAGFRARR